MRQDLDITISIGVLDELLNLAASKALADKTIQIVIVFKLVKIYWTHLSQNTRINILRELEACAAQNPHADFVSEILADLKSIKTF